MSRLQDDSLSEDDIVNILLELAKLKITVPALHETGAGLVLNKMRKEKEGRVAEIAGELVLRWKRIAEKYVEEGNDLDPAQESSGGREGVQHQEQAAQVQDSGGCEDSQPDGGTQQGVQRYKCVGRRQRL